MPTTPAPTAAIRATEAAAPLAATPGTTGDPTMTMMPGARGATGGRTATTTKEGGPGDTVTAEIMARIVTARGGATTLTRAAVEGLERGGVARGLPMTLGVPAKDLGPPFRRSQQLRRLLRSLIRRRCWQCSVRLPL